jgi:hypothetical protein
MKELSKRGWPLSHVGDGVRDPVLTVPDGLLTQPALGPFSCSGLPMPRLNEHMPTLTRRQNAATAGTSTTPTCTLARSRDARARRSTGTSGNGFCGFYPGSHPGEYLSGTAARAKFERAWRIISAKRTEADYQEWRDARD